MAGPKGPIGGGGPMGGVMRGGVKAKDFKGTLTKVIKYMKNQLFLIIFAFILALVSVICTINMPNILGGATDELIIGVTKMNVYDNVTDAISEAQAKMPPGAPALEFDTVKDFFDAVTEQDPEAADVINNIPEKYRSEVMDVRLDTRPKINTDAILKIIKTLIVLILLSVVLSYSQGFIMAGIAQRISFNFRRDISKNINRLPLSYYDKTTHGEVLSHITNDVDTISTTLNQSLSQIITSVVTVVGVLYMMLRISVFMTFCALIILPLSLGFIGFIIKRSQKYFQAQQAYLGHVNSHIEEMYTAHTVVQLFGGEQKSKQKFGEINEQLSFSAWRSQFLSGLMMPAMSFIGNLGYVLVCVVGGLLTVRGTITVGNIQAFIQYIRQFNQPIAQMASITNTLQSTVAAAERVFSFLEATPEVETGTKTPTSVGGDVTFEHVRFGYTPEKVVINDFSAHIKAGQRVAIVGPTGAGKTTIVKLLMRFYPILSGDILIDGVNIEDYTKSSLRDSFGMVLQDTWLFSGTIMENIRYGRLDATDDEVYAAAKAACADHFIKTLPNNYKFVIDEEGGNISQGEKQLLTIARAILSEPKLLILDEATSSVDTRTELLIQKAMLNLMADKTSFIIAHRLSTIRDADLILVLKDGDIVEQGKHDELLLENGFYAALYNSQFTTGVVEEDTL